MLISELSHSQPLLLDTHIWVWASGNSGGPSRFAATLSPKIETAANQSRLFVSVASVWEIALKAQRGVILLSTDLRVWVREQKSNRGARVLPLTSAIVIESTQLPLWLRSDGKEHKDPNDRFLAATARRKNAVLITCDELILKYAAQGHVKAYDARL